MRQVGIETRLTLRQSKILHQGHRPAQHMWRNSLYFYIYVIGYLNCSVLYKNYCISAYVAAGKFCCNTTRHCGMICRMLQVEIKCHNILILIVTWRLRIVLKHRTNSLFVVFFLSQSGCEYEKNILIPFPVGYEEILFFRPFIYIWTGWK